MAFLSGPTMDTPRRGKVIGDTAVRQNSTPPGFPSPSSVKGKPAVAGGSPVTVSVGKNPSSQGGVSLGTTYGKHDVAHRISGNKGGKGPSGSY